MAPHPTIDAVNRHTARWVRALPSTGDAVVSGAGTWLLLAALLAAADGPAEVELAAAVGFGRADALDALDRVADVLDGADGLSAASGMWTATGVRLLDPFVERCRGLTVAELPADPGDLDRWAGERTHGMVPRFPAEITPDVRLVVATAIAADAEWAEPFDDAVGATWSGVDHRYPRLRRRTTATEQATIVRGSTTISRVTCATSADLDVHLVAGPPEASPADVLAVAIEAATTPVLVEPASRLALGDRAGCLTVVEVAEVERRPQLMVLVPAFTLSATHDLLARPELFGLATATDDRRGHFPHLAEEPLAVGAAAQHVTATFDARGFRAGAVSAASLVAGAGPPSRPKKTRMLVADHDRPFGFVATERTTGLVVFAGWVDEPPG